MKKTILSTSLVFYFVSVLFTGCDNTAQTKQASTDSTSSLNTVATTPMDATVWRSLNGKYPSDAKLFETDNALSLRLKKLLGDAEYADFQQRMVVQMPISADKKTVFMSACMPHSCTFDEAALALDLDTDKLWVAILKDGDISTKTDGDMAAAPLLFTNYIKEYTKK